MHTLSLEELQEGTILLVNKPKSWSSFDIVKKLKRLVIGKIGHGGTLDPLASGLMLIATGKKTKELSHLSGLSKEYTGIFHVGATTPSYDLETKVSETQDISHLRGEDILNAAAGFVGNIMQRPPIFSAIRIDGKRSYKLARKGETPEMPERAQEIISFEIEKIELPQVWFRVRCSKGTYIRSLAHDFGQALGVGAYLEELTRTRIGDYKLEDAWNILELTLALKKLKEAYHEGI